MAQRIAPVLILLGFLGSPGWAAEFTATFDKGGQDLVAQTSPGAERIALGPKMRDFQLDVNLTLSAEDGEKRLMVHFRAHEKPCHQSNAVGLSFIPGRGWHLGVYQRRSRTTSEIVMQPVPGLKGRWGDWLHLSLTVEGDLITAALRHKGAEVNLVTAQSRIETLAPAGSFMLASEWATCSWDDLAIGPIEGPGNNADDEPENDTPLPSPTAGGKFIGQLSLHLREPRQITLSRLAGTRSRRETASVSGQPQAPS